MNKYKIIRKLALFFSMIMLITSTVNTTYCFIVTSTAPNVNVFIPEDKTTGRLTLYKTVEHPYGTYYNIPANISFDFIIELGAGYANTTLDTNYGVMTTDDTGSLNVSLQPDSALTIDGLLAGTRVKITEQATAFTGFDISDGISTKEVIIAADNNTFVEFINTYTPESTWPDNVTVTGTKVLEGRDWQEGDSFTFLLEWYDGWSWNDLGTRTVTYNPDNANFNKFDFTELLQSVTFDTTGSYAFRMTEIAGELDNMNYDTTVNYFYIDVADDYMDGYLYIDNVDSSQNAVTLKSGSNYNVEVTFNNTFTAPDIPVPDDIALAITAHKTIINTGKKSIGPDGFEFILENIVTGERMAINSDVNGNAIFTLPFTADDIDKTYVYQLTETNDGRIDIIYDTRIYDIQVTITLDENNTLIPVIVMNGSHTDSCVAEFTNTYDPSVVPSTGDNSKLAFWLVLMLISGTTCITLAIFDIRDKSKVKY